MRLPKQSRDNDCLRAAFAGLLGVTMRKLPDPDMAVGPEEWWQEWRDGLERLGHRLVCHEGAYDSYLGTGIEERPELPTSGRWIAVVPSLTFRGATHAILMEGSKLLHDPGTNKPRQRAPSKVFFGVSLEPLEAVAP